MKVVKVNVTKIPPGSKSKPELHVKVRGTKAELEGASGLDLAERSARKEGWDPSGPGWASILYQYNLREYERVFAFERKRR